jgi:hypothetical protein
MAKSKKVVSKKADAPVSPADRLGSQYRCRGALADLSPIAATEELARPAVVAVSKRSRWECTPGDVP